VHIKTEPIRPCELSRVSFNAVEPFHPIVSPSVSHSVLSLKLVKLTVELTDLKQQHQQFVVSNELERNLEREKSQAQLGLVITTNKALNRAQEARIDLL
jgi:hypothetical protein